jgi:hypothetical protein
MALATAGHLDYPSAIRGKATYGIGDVAAKWSVVVPRPDFGVCFLPCYEKSKPCDGVWLNEKNNEAYLDGEAHPKGAA